MGGGRLRKTLLLPVDKTEIVAYNNSIKVMGPLAEQTPPRSPNFFATKFLGIAYMYTMNKRIRKPYST
jgi:hypothetical protein